MRLAGRLLIAALLLISLVGLLLAAHAALSAAGFTNSPGRDGPGAAKPTLVYVLRQEPTEFVFSKPQDRIRLLTSVELRPGAAAPSYGILLEAIGAEGEVVLRERLFARSIPLAVRDRQGRLIPHAFLREPGSLRPSASESVLVEFQRPATSVRLSMISHEPGLRRVFARVQEQRTPSARQLKVGWERLSRSEQEELVSGNPLGASLVDEEDRRRLLSQRWHPVAPSGVEEQDYIGAILYERPGPVIATGGSES